MTYRPEIDGLRAIAVLVVVFFHAGFASFSGGYVGVDVFFVISGYLITSILLNDLRRERFSIVRFYERRARRILPALFFVLVPTTVVAWLWMLPEQLEDYCEALLSVALFASNIWFWRDANYFAPTGEENPLLHTWSLAVEEQFYLFFPILLWALWRARARWRIGSLVALSVASLGLAEWASHHYPTPNFFLIPTRIWELGAGALCAFGLGLRSPPAGRGREALAVVGLGAILISVVAFDASTPFPSLIALLPVVGTVLIVLGAQPHSGVGRLLASRPVVHVGLLSYSLYLWHQPLFAFARQLSDGAVSGVELFVLALCALVLAQLSWRYVEQPFRAHAARPLSRRAVFIGAGVGLVVVMLVGVAGKLTHGARPLWEQLHPELASTYEVVQRARSDRGKTFDDGACRFNLKQLQPAHEDRLRACFEAHGGGVLVLGDSHSIDLFAGLYAATTAPFLVGVTSGGCRPDAPGPKCSFGAVKALLSDNPLWFDHVLFTQSGAYLMQLPTGETGRKIFRRLTANSALVVDDYAPAQSSIEAVLRYLSGLTAHANVTWVGSRTEPHISIGTILRQGCDQPFVLREGLAEVFQRLDEDIAPRARAAGVDYLPQSSAHPLAFPQDFGNCDGFFWSDGDHWTTAGAERFVRRLLRGRADLGDALGIAPVQRQPQP